MLDQASRRPGVGQVDAKVAHPRQLPFRVIARRVNNGHAFVGERLCHSEADPGTGAGHDCRLAFQFEIHLQLLSTGSSIAIPR
jgi:hypothetical protein